VVRGGRIDVREGSSGLDWQYRDWQHVTCVRTTPRAISDIVHGRRTPSEVWFDHELGLAPRHLATWEISTPQINVWLFSLLRLADEQARALGHARVLDELTRRENGR
jgi:hypothetical protein